MASETEVRDKISRFLRQDDARPLIEKIKERRDACLRSLGGNSELIEIGRSQGRVDILNWVLKLRED